MGSNISKTDSEYDNSSDGTINWNGTYTESPERNNEGLEVIDLNINFNDIISESETATEQKIDSDSPFITTEVFNKIMKGGGDVLSSEQKTSDLENIIDNNSFSSTSDMKDVLKKNSSDNINNKYGFSSTSSEAIQTSVDNYTGGGNNISDTPYNLSSESINSSDVNLVSVDSRNGRRILH